MPFGAGTGLFVPVFFLLPRSEAHVRLSQFSIGLSKRRNVRFSWRWTPRGGCKGKKSPASLNARLWLELKRFPCFFGMSGHVTPKKIFSSCACGLRFMRICPHAPIQSLPMLLPDQTNPRICLQRWQYRPMRLVPLLRSFGPLAYAKVSQHERAFHVT